MRKANHELSAEVAKMLAIARRMLRRGPEALTPEDTALWCTVLSEAGVQACDVLPALVRYMETEAWFPAPAQIIEHCRVFSRRRCDEELQRILESRHKELPETPKHTIHESIEDAVAIYRRRERTLRQFGAWNEERERARKVIVAGELTPMGDILAAAGITESNVDTDVSGGVQ